MDEIEDKSKECVPSPLLDNPDADHDNQDNIGYIAGIINNTPDEEVPSIMTNTADLVESILEDLKERYPQLGIDQEDQIRQSIWAKLSMFQDSNQEKQPETKPSKSFNFSEAYEAVERQIDEYMGDLLFEGLKKGRMPMHIFYTNYVPWFELCKEPSYTLQAKGKKILERDVPKMIEIVAPKEHDTMRVYDFGVGDGTKGKIIIDKILGMSEEKGSTLEYHGVDGSAEMLRIALNKMAEAFMQHASLMKDKKRRTWKSDRWLPLIEFLYYNKLELLNHVEIFEKVSKTIFGKHCTDPQNVDLLKYLFARMLNLHKKNKKDMPKLRELDNKVHLPISLHAHPVLFEDLNKEEFVPGENEGVAIFDLGSEICNRFPGKSVERFYNLLPTPKTPDHEDGLVPLSEEKSVHAAYAVLGLQLGEILETKAEKRAFRSAIRAAYNNDAFRKLTSHPFERSDVKYTNLETGEPMEFGDVGFIYADYEEDPDNQGYYGTTLRLYITEDIEITNVKNEKMIIKGKEAAYGNFKKIVEEMFSEDPEVRKFWQGIRIEVATKAVVKGSADPASVTKEEMLKLDPKVFYEKDYGTYGNGMMIAAQILGKKRVDNLGLHQTLLYPSYKPTIEQMIMLCHEGGLKVIEVYSDAGENENGRPSYTKMLTRKMTPEEEELYKKDPQNSEFFYSWKQKLISTDEIRKNGKSTNAYKTINAPTPKQKGAGKRIQG